MSALKDLFEAIKLQINNDLPTEVPTVRFFYNQLINEEGNTEQAFPRPAVFIEYDEIFWTSKPYGVQEAEVTVTVHLSVESMTLEELGLFDLVEKVNKSLSRVPATNQFGRMTRFKERPPDNPTNVYTHEIDYRLLIRECSAADKIDGVTVTLDTLTIIDEIVITDFVNTRTAPTL